jgi:monofunctional biosynthetic peptidoglycan transglycosylase
MAGRRRSPLFRAVRAALIAVLALLALPYLLTPLYTIGQPVSTLMMWRWVTGQPVTRSWVALDAVAPVLPLTVIAAEDARYCSHAGIDWTSLQDAIEDAQDGEVSGGGSTITQQVAKNLFLWPGRSFVRKALEVPLAMWIDLVLSKRRVLEIYLNIAEWGPDGQFGAEAGSQHAFRRSSEALSPQQAALMAAILPNPLTRSAGNPGPGVRRMAATYVARARTSADIAACLDLERPAARRKAAAP